MQQLQNTGTDKEPEIQKKKPTSMLDFSIRYGIADPLGPKMDLTETGEVQIPIIYVLKQSIKWIKVKLGRLREKLSFLSPRCQ
jgi:hypothetical protein